MVFTVMLMVTMTSHIAKQCFEKCSECVEVSHRGTQFDCIDDADGFSYMTDRQAMLWNAFRLHRDITIKPAPRGRLPWLELLNVHLCRCSWAQKAQRAASEA